MKKKKSRVFLLVLLILLLLLCALCVWQRNNLAALRLSRQLSREELSDRMENNAQYLTETAESISGVSVRGLTEEEKTDLNRGTLSSDELIDRLVGEPAPAGETAGSAAALAPATPAEPAAPAPAAPVSDPDRDELARLIAKIYVMEEQYTAWLKNANQAAIDEFNALPEAERTAQRKYVIGLDYVALAQEKEKECDAEMAEVENAIRAVLKRLGEDGSLADEIHTAYLDEKATMKAYYLNLH